MDALNTVKSGQHTKTILCIFCQQNQLNFPQYILTEENKDVPEIEWRLFRARFKLDGRSVVGSGRTKKEAETAAARKFLNNNFLTGLSSSQAENLPGINDKKNIPPSKKNKQIRRLEAFLKKKDKEKSRSEAMLECLASVEVKGEDLVQESK